ncbi:MAG: DUF2959 family protein [Planctomycetota bacterium]
MQPTARTLALVASALLLPACGMFSGQDKSLAQVDDLVSCIERVHVDSELAKQAATLAMSRLQAMVAPDFQSDAVLAHAELVRAIEDAEKQAKDLRYSVDRMKRAADPVFSRWTRDIQAMQSPEIKQRSQTRFDETKARYDAIVEAVDPTLRAYDTFNRGIKDHALFLGHDFNPSAVATIEAEVRKLAGSSQELGSGFDRCMQSARAYVDSAALPMRVEAARPAPR